MLTNPLNAQTWHFYMQSKHRFGNIIPCVFEQLTDTTSIYKLTLSGSVKSYCWLSHLDFYHIIDYKWEGSNSTLV